MTKYVVVANDRNKVGLQEISIPLDLSKALDFAEKLKDDMDIASNSNKHLSDIRVYEVNYFRCEFFKEKKGTQKSPFGIGS